MSKFTCKPDFPCESTIINGNSVDVNINYCDSEIRADIMVSEFNSIRLWGRVINKDGDPVKDALVKLLKIERLPNCQYKFVGVAHTISDCEGFYQFEISPCANEDSSSYRILVNKAAYGPERIIPINSSNCDVNDNCNCRPSEIPTQRPNFGYELE